MLICSRTFLIDLSKNGFGCLIEKTYIEQGLLAPMLLGVTYPHFLFAFFADEQRWYGLAREEREHRRIRAMSGNAAYFDEMQQMRVMLAENALDVLPILLHVRPAQFTTAPIMRRQRGETSEMILLANFGLQRQR